MPTKPTAKAKPITVKGGKPPAPEPSPKAKPMKAAIKQAKKAVGLKAGAKARLDLAASKARDASLTGRSQRNNKR